VITRSGPHPTLLAATAHGVFRYVPVLTPRATGSSTVSAAPAAVPTVDPRLIIHPQTVAIAGVLSGGMHLSGTLYPTIPGANTLRLTLRRGSGEPVLGAHIRLVATMPGMALVHGRAVLAFRHGRYSGVLRLPMFGFYLAQVVVDTPAGHYTGVITLTLPLPLSGG
jgi:hypothetical protein